MGVGGPCTDIADFIFPYGGHTWELIPSDPHRNLLPPFREATVARAHSLMVGPYQKPIMLAFPYGPYGGAIGPINGENHPTSGANYTVNSSSPFPLKQGRPEKR